MSHFKALLHLQTGELKETSHFLALPSWHGGKNEICMDSAEQHIHFWRAIMLTGALKEESLSTSCLAAPRFPRVSDRACSMEPTFKWYFPQKTAEWIKRASLQKSPTTVWLLPNLENVYTHIYTDWCLVVALQAGVISNELVIQEKGGKRSWADWWGVWNHYWPSSTPTFCTVCVCVCQPPGSHCAPHAADCTWRIWLYAQRP